MVRCFRALVCPFVFWVIALSAAQGDIVTFHFSVVLSNDYGSQFDMPVGTVGTGWYRFDTATAASLGPDSTDNLFAIYPDAIQEFYVDFGTYGVASGGPGSIFIGDPVLTTGSFNFKSDTYQAFASVSEGIVVPSAGGDRKSLSAGIFLQDLDMTGLNSEILTGTPPSLAPFKDNLTLRPLPDAAELQMNFSIPGGGLTTISFELTSLSAVPEPGSAILLLPVAALWLRRYQPRRAGDVSPLFPGREPQR